MKALRGTGLALMVVLAGVILAAPAQAEDLRGRWYAGGAISYFTTIDDVRSNAFIIFTKEFGDDGIPFTGDPNELTACGGLGSAAFFPGQDPFCDPRPDDLLARDNVIEDDFRLDLTVGFGLSRSLSLQLDASYFTGQIGPVDVFIRESIPVANSVNQPFVLNLFKDFQTSVPTAAGEITEIPVSLSAIVRFRQDSPLNPYIGAGIGYVFTDLDVDGDIGRLNNRLNGLRIRGVGNEFGQEITPEQFGTVQRLEGQVPNLWPVDIDVSDSFMWHLTGGVEYFFNDRFSMVFDARYQFADTEVTITMRGQDQIDFLIYPEDMFHPDGMTRIFSFLGKAPNTLCTDAGPEALNWGCSEVGPTAPPSDRISINAGGVGGCPNRAEDFDGNGLDDLCYHNPAASPAGSTQPGGIFLVQGGVIDLTGFAVAIGARFHF